MEPIDIEYLTKMMEEMAGLPKEKLGEKQPGERGSYEKHLNPDPRPPIEYPVIALG